MPGASALVFSARCLGGIAGHTSAFSGSPCQLEAGQARENSKAALSRMEPNQVNVTRALGRLYLDFSRIVTASATLDPTGIPRSRRLIWT